jgi:hypothetical protein
MSLRDFNNAPFPNDPRALHNEPLGNGAGLESFHTIQPQDVSPNNTPKIVGAVAVALMIGVAGFALYTSAGSHPKAVVASNAEPAQPVPPPPAPAAADAEMAATTPPAAADTTPAAPVKEATTPTVPVKEASIPKKKHHIASAEPSKNAEITSTKSAMAAEPNASTVQPPAQQAVTTPTPSPSPSDVATNNTQSGVAVSPNATSASDIPAPAPQQQPSPQPASPAPAQPAGAEQSAGQVNQ